LKKIIGELSALGVWISWVDGKLVAKPSSAITPEVAGLIRRHRSDLVDLLSGSCTPHNDEANYINAAAGGRIRTTCRRCGRFIGYRPADSGPSAAERTI
jgi:hypothetical protein